MIVFMSIKLKRWLKENTPAGSVFEDLDSFGEEAYFKYLIKPPSGAYKLFAVRLPEKVCRIEPLSGGLLDCFVSEAIYISGNGATEEVD